jgi:uncharacterized protein (TIGR03382 family)
VQLAFDAVRLTRVDTDGDGDGSDMDGPHAGDETGGCNAGGSSSGLALVALLGFVGRRRRRRG